MPGPYEAGMAGVENVVWSLMGQSRKKQSVTKNSRSVMSGGYGTVIYRRTVSWVSRLRAYAESMQNRNTVSPPVISS